MSTIDVNESGGKLRVLSPYHPDFPAKAKRLGGKFDSVRKEWQFDPRDEERVRDLLRATYGTDGSPATANDLVTVRLKALREQSAWQAGVYFAGRCLASASGRDSGARLQAGVVCLEKNARSGGSVKNWYTIIPEGCVLELRDVPRLAVEQADADGWEMEVLSNETAAGVTEPTPENPLARFTLAELESEVSRRKKEMP